MIFLKVEGYLRENKESRMQQHEMLTKLYSNDCLLDDNDLVAKRAKFIEEAIKKLVSFAKNIPGFKSLSMNDQMSLIKGMNFFPPTQGLMWYVDLKYTSYFHSCAVQLVVSVSISGLLQQAPAVYNTAR